MIIKASQNRAENFAATQRGFLKIKYKFVKTIFSQFYPFNLPFVTKKNLYFNIFATFELINWLNQPIRGPGWMLRVYQTRSEGINNKLIEEFDWLQPCSRRTNLSKYLPNF